MAKKVPEQVMDPAAQGTSATTEAAEVASAAETPISVVVPTEVHWAKGKKRAREEEKGKTAAAPSKLKRPPPSTTYHDMGVFMSDKILMHNKVGLPLSPKEQGVFNSEVFEGMLAALMEMQVRGFVISKRLYQSLKSREKKEEELKKSLEEASGAKAGLESKLAESDSQLDKMKTALKTSEKKAEELGKQLKDMKKQVVTLQKKNYDSEMSLAIATTEVVEKDALLKNKDERIEYLKGGLVGEHEEGFSRAIRQAVFFSSKGIPIGKMCFDVNKDFYNGMLVNDEDIPQEVVNKEGVDAPASSCQDRTSSPRPVENPTSSTLPETLDIVID